MNAAKAYVDIKTLQVYPDASGAPATVHVADYVFAADYIGCVKLTCIKPGHGSRTESKIAARRAAHAYQSEVLKQTNTDWLVRNAAMYTPGA